MRRLEETPAFCLPQNRGGATNRVTKTSPEILRLKREQN